MPAPRARETKFALSKNRKRVEAVRRMLRNSICANGVHREFDHVMLSRCHDPAATRDRFATSDRFTDVARPPLRRVLLRVVAETRWERCLRMEVRAPCKAVAEAVRCCRAALAAGAGLGCRDRPGGLGAVHLWKSPALDCATLSPRDRPRIGSMPVSDRVCFSCADGDTICARSPAGPA